MLLLLSVEVVFALVLNVQLQLFNLLKVTVNLHLETVIFCFEVLTLVHYVSQLLVPLCTLTLVIQKQFGLLGFCL